ncbi:MAG: hypothetical protein O3A56_09780 [Proteobacteria bacterium]|nr:hypothetical protein [Pseudomonadota bacterium]
MKAKHLGGRIYPGLRHLLGSLGYAKQASIKTPHKLLLILERQSQLNSFNNLKPPNHYIKARDIRTNKKHKMPITTFSIRLSHLSGKNTEKTFRVSRTGKQKNIA